MAAVAVKSASEPREGVLFGKWSYDGLSVRDLSLVDYVAMSGKSCIFIPHTSGRWQRKRFRKASIPIVERLVCSLMMHGRNAGLKIQAIQIVRACFEMIHLVTGENPIQVYIDAVLNGGPREDSTSIGSAGVARRQAVDVSPMRRVNQAVYLMCQGARKGAFRGVRSMAECLADEIMACAKEAPTSFAIKKKDEIERVAKANR